METQIVSDTYRLKWQLKHDNKYKVTECSKIINTNTGRIIKRTLNGYTEGFWIGKKFIRPKDLNKHIEVIPNYNMPF